MTRAGSSSRTSPRADSESANPSPEQLLQIALLHHRKGDHEREVDDYKRLITARPGNFAYLNNLAWTLSEDLKQPEEGIKWINEAIQKGGPIPQLLDTRGVILTRLGKFDDAIKDFATSHPEDA